MHSREGQAVRGRVGTLGSGFRLGPMWQEVAGARPGSPRRFHVRKAWAPPVRCVCAWPVQSGSHTTPRTVSPAGAGTAAPVGLRGRREGGPALSGCCLWPRHLDDVTSLVLWTGSWGVVL